jgi:hypothetical protein
MLKTERMLLARAEGELLAETGWEEVSKGLIRILFAHLLLIATIILFAGVLIFAGSEVDVANPGSKVTTFLVVAMVGLALVFGMTIISAGMIVYGQWRCLMFAPERCGAKLLMFGVLFCTITGPALSMSFGLSKWGTPPPPPTRPKKLTATDAFMQRAEFYRDNLTAQSTTGYVELACAGLGALANLMFILFLRAVARCWDDRVRVLIVDFYLGFALLLYGAGVYLFVIKPQLILQKPEFLLYLGVGWIAQMLWYLFLLLLISAGISYGVANRRSPLDPSSVRPPVHA